MKVKFTVSFELPLGATKKAAQAYVKDAVASYKGCYDPEDPIFDIDNNTLRVARFHPGLYAPRHRKKSA